MVAHDLRLRRYVCWREMRVFQSLSLDPSKGFEILQEVIVLRQLGGQLHTVVVSTLRDPRNGLDLFDLLVVRRGDTVHERSDLGTKVRGRDERSEDVLWKDISEGSCIVLDIIVGDMDILKTKRQVGCGDRTDSPVGLAAEHLLFVVGRGDSLDRVTVYIGCLRLDGGNLTLRFGRLLEGGHLLTLFRRRGDLLTKNDITDFAGSERSDIDTVSFSEILWVHSEKVTMAVLIDNVQPG